MKNIFDIFELEFTYSINDGEEVTKTINVFPILFVLLLVITHLIIN